MTAKSAIISSSCSRSSSEGLGSLGLIGWDCAVVIANFLCRSDVLRLSLCSKSCLALSRVSTLTAWAHARIALSKDRTQFVSNILKVPFPIQLKLLEIDLDVVEEEKLYQDLVDSLEKFDHFKLLDVMLVRSYCIHPDFKRFWMGLQAKPKILDVFDMNFDPEITNVHLKHLYSENLLYLSLTAFFLTAEDLANINSFCPNLQVKRFTGVQVVSEFEVLHLEKCLCADLSREIALAQLSVYYGIDDDNDIESILSLSEKATSLTLYDVVLNESHFKEILTISSLKNLTLMSSNSLREDLLIKSLTQIETNVEQLCLPTFSLSYYDAVDICRTQKKVSLLSFKLDTMALPSQHSAEHQIKRASMKKVHRRKIIFEVSNFGYLSNLGKLPTLQNCAPEFDVVVNGRNLVVQVNVSGFEIYRNFKESSCNKVLKNLKNLLPNLMVDAPIE